MRSKKTRPPPMADRIFWGSPLFLGYRVCNFDTMRILKHGGRRCYTVRSNQCYSQDNRKRSWPNLESTVACGVSVGAPHQAVVYRLSSPARRAELGRRLGPGGMVSGTQFNGHNVDQPTTGVIMRVLHRFHENDLGPVPRFAMPTSGARYNSNLRNAELVRRSTIHRSARNVRKGCDRPGAGRLTRRPAAGPTRNV